MYKHSILSHEELEPFLILFAIYYKKKYFSLLFKKNLIERCILAMTVSFGRLSATVGAKVSCIPLISYDETMVIIVCKYSIFWNGNNRGHFLKYLCDVPEAGGWLGVTSTVRRSARPALDG